MEGWAPIYVRGAQCSIDASIDITPVLLVHAGPLVPGIRKGDRRAASRGLKVTMPNRRVPRVGDGNARMGAWVVVRTSQ